MKTEINPTTPLEIRSVGAGVGPNARGRRLGVVTNLVAMLEDGEVIGHSVHQAIYDWRHARGVRLYRNEFLLQRFHKIFEEKETYRFQTR